MIIAAKAATGGVAATTQAIISTQSLFIYSTKDGVTFTLSANLSANVSTITACGYFENKWLIGGDNGAIASSNDELSTWTNSTVGATTGRKRRFVTGGSTCVVAGNLATGTGFARYNAEYSTAIATFTQQNTNLSTTNFRTLYGAATNGSGTFAVCGDGPSAENYYSTTNLTTGWTSRTIGMNTAYATAFGSSLWVVGGAGGALYTSSDLVTWTSRTSQTANAINSITFANNLFVLVADNGSISTSTNGTTWTARTSGTSAILNDVQYAPGLGLWIVCGDAGTILTSSDAITWTSRSIPSPGYSLARIATKP